MIRADIPVFDRLQDELVASSGTGARRILELGTGTGETAAPAARSSPRGGAAGIDESAAMLAAARARAAGRAGRAARRTARGAAARRARSTSWPARCASTTSTPSGRQSCSRAFAARSAPGGRFVLADVVVPADPARGRDVTDRGLRPAPARWPTSSSGSPRRDSTPGWWVSGDLARGRGSPGRRLGGRPLAPLVSRQSVSVELPPDFFNRPLAEVDPEIAEVLGARARPPAAHAGDDRLGELRSRLGARVPGLGADEQVRRGLSRASATTAAASTSTSPSSSPSTARRSCSAPSTPTCSRTPARRPTRPSTTLCCSRATR